MNNCEILKNKIKKYIDSTDYPIKPELSTRKQAMPSQLQQRAAATNRFSKPEVPIRNTQRPPTLTLNLRQRASNQSTGSLSSLGNSPNATPTSPILTHDAE